MSCDNKLYKGAGVAGILFNQNGHILLIKRRDVPIWVLPGGGIDKDEKASQAILREFFEETGLSINVKRLVAEYVPSGFFSRHTLVYECELKEGSPKIGQESLDIGFFPLNNLPKITFPMHLLWVQQALKNEGPIQSKTEGLSIATLFRYSMTHPILVLRFLLSRMGIPFNN